jgi:predicted transcriptional regulator
MTTTTVQLQSETKKILDDLKLNPRETYDDVVRRLAAMAYDDDPLTEEEIAGIAASVEDIRKGRFQTLKQVRDELGI